ncbi:hypothetical protein HanHA300_Chr12g0463671 [Helianthus annuus]|nr:hypothetical protein HanHA300_Chr12g0463671 [Helianthus annuus]KAJ0507076.1 hypothetical protein HanHA89_Chr12g0489171 [Helianthus annuus]KAJ0864645.1 hypothetical protein HanPSC8_Chr12g0544341 [Helianthus annuus]
MTDMTVEFLCLFVESKFYREMEFASNATGFVPMVQWPLFLLASKIFVDATFGGRE